MSYKNVLAAVVPGILFLLLIAGCGGGGAGNTPGTTAGGTKATTGGTTGAKVPEIPAKNEKDIHGLEYANNADLTIFFAGNQYPVVPELLEEFKKKYPEARNIFYETLPPGILAQQIRAGKANFKGQEITAQPDVYLSTTKELVDGLAKDGFIDASKAQPYVKNRLVLIVAQGNPKNIQGLGDLKREDVRVSMPNPEREGIAKYILNMYRDYGGPEFEKTIMDTKKNAGTTILTTVHHRETPDNLEQGKADVGPVWFTEYQEAKATGRKIDLVEVGEQYDQQKKITYYIAPLKKAPHPDLAQKFTAFVLSPEGQRIYAKYGFIPVALPSGGTTSEPTSSGGTTQETTATHSGTDTGTTAQHSTSTTGGGTTKK